MEYEYQWIIKYEGKDDEYFMTAYHYKTKADVCEEFQIPVSRNVTRYEPSKREVK